MCVCVSLVHIISHVYTPTGHPRRPRRQTQAPKAKSCHGWLILGSSGHPIWAVLKTTVGWFWEHFMGVWKPLYNHELIFSNIGDIQVIQHDTTHKGWVFGWLVDEFWDWNTSFLLSQDSIRWIPKGSMGHGPFLGSLSDWTSPVTTFVDPKKIPRISKNHWILKNPTFENFDPTCWHLLLHTPPGRACLWLGAIGLASRGIPTIGSRHYAMLLHLYNSVYIYIYTYVYI